MPSRLGLGDGGRVGLGSLGLGSLGLAALLAVCPGNKSRLKS